MDIAPEGTAADSCRMSRSQLRRPSLACLLGGVLLILRIQLGFFFHPILSLAKF